MCAVRRAVDVVIPAYNAARWIGDAVESALSQRDVLPRVVVVNDESSDGTLDVLARFVPKVMVISQPNRGASVARNVGVARGSAPFVAFLDADDVWAPDFLALQTELLESHPDLDLAVTDHYQFEDGGLVVLPSFLSRHEGFQQIPRRQVSGGQSSFVFERLIGDDLVVGMFLWTGALCVRRRAFEASGGFDATLRRAQDHDLWLRLCRNGRVGVILQPLAGRRLHADSASSDELAWLESELQILAKIERSPEMFPPTARRMLASRPRIYTNAGRLAEGQGDLQRARQYYLKAYRVGETLLPAVLAGLTLLPAPLRAIVNGVVHLVRESVERGAI